MNGLWQKFTALDKTVQIAIIIVVGVLLGIGLFFGANYLGFVDKLIETV